MPRLNFRRGCSGCDGIMEAGDFCTYDRRTGLAFCRPVCWPESGAPSANVYAALAAHKNGGKDYAERTCRAPNAPRAAAAPAAPAAAPPAPRPDTTPPAALVHPDESQRAPVMSISGVPLQPAAEVAAPGAPDATKVPPITASCGCSLQPPPWDSFGSWTITPCPRHGVHVHSTRRR